MTVMRQVTFLLLGAGGVWNDDDGEQHARPIASHATLRVSLCHRCRHARPIASHATLRVSLCHRCRHAGITPHGSYPARTALLLSTTAPQTNRRSSTSYHVDEEHKKEESVNDSSYHVTENTKKK